MTPSSRTIAHLKEQGYQVGLVERYVRFGQTSMGKRYDLFGLIDYIAMKPGEKILGVQSTGQGFAEHMTKITVERRKEALAWLATGHAELVLYGWRKLKVKRGGTAMVYKPRIHYFDSATDFPATEESLAFP